MSCSYFLNSFLDVFHIIEFVLFGLLSIIYFGYTFYVIMKNKKKKYLIFVHLLISIVIYYILYRCVYLGGINMGGMKYWDNCVEDPVLNEVIWVVGSFIWIFMGTFIFIASKLFNKKKNIIVVSIIGCIFIYFIGVSINRYFSNLSKECGFSYCREIQVYVNEN